MSATSSKVQAIPGGWALSFEPALRDVEKFSIFSPEGEREPLLSALSHPFTEKGRKLPDHVVNYCKSAVILYDDGQFAPLVENTDLLVEALDLKIARLQNRLSLVQCELASREQTKEDEVSSLSV